MYLINQFDLTCSPILLSRRVASVRAETYCNVFSLQVQLTFILIVTIIMTTMTIMTIIITTIMTIVTIIMTMPTIQVDHFNAVLENYPFMRRTMESVAAERFASSLIIYSDH